MKAVKGIIFLAIIVVFLLAGGMTDVQAGFEGVNNTFYGQGAGAGTSGDNDYDTFIGRYAGFNNTTGLRNTFLGYGAGYANTTGSSNTFLGDYAGFNNNTGYYNTFIGRAAGISNGTGFSNTFLGYYAGYSNYTGYNNTFVGNFAGEFNSTGYYNTFLGDSAGNHNTSGRYNTFLGINAGYSNLSGEGNVFLGYTAGYYEAGSDRLYIDSDSTSDPLIYGEFDNRKLKVNGNLEVIGPDNGLVRLSNVSTDATTKVSRMVLKHYSNLALPVYLFGAASTSTNNFVAFGGGNSIGNAATQIDLFTADNPTTPVGTPRLTIIGNGDVGIGTQTPSYPLQMASGAHVTTGGAWTNASSREYKENISELSADKAVETLNGLNPVEFNYKTDKEEKYVGFIAEDVPDLVATNDRKGLSPMDIVAVLTSVVKEQQNEVMEQKKVLQEQQKIIANLAEKVTDLERELRLRGTLAKAEYLP